ncbi:MAG: signal peptidase I [Lachnospiraceae bacterium]|nr:signal peptidase I [Lachnospiraceae bacterium]
MKATALRKWLIWITGIVIAILLVLFLLNKYILINIRVPSGSMKETIQINDKLIASRISYVLENIERYDIVVADASENGEGLILKRVIGLPGEMITIANGQIFINNSDIPIEEDYLAEEWTEANDGYEFVVPEDSYLLLGDNRNDSYDARFWKEDEKYICRENIIAKVLFRYDPSCEWIDD